MKNQHEADPIVLSETVAAALPQHVAIWRQRMRAQQLLAAQLATQAKEDARQIALMLRDRFGATRVILFGSLAKGTFAADSDIDLAVAGIAKADFFTALADANSLAHTWVDLKPFEDLSPHFRQRVLETGEDLL